MTRCPMCGGLGWTLDCNDLSQPGPRMIEFMPCFFPDCETSGQPIWNLCFKDAPFNHVSISPLDGLVMSVSVLEGAGAVGRDRWNESEGPGRISPRDCVYNAQSEFGRAWCSEDYNAAVVRLRDGIDWLRRALEQMVMPDAVSHQQVPTEED
jgi:hypothetical protein